MHSKITVGVDNKKVHNDVTNETFKASAYVQDTGAKIVKIRLLVREMQFQVEFKFLRIKKGTLGHCSVNPYNCLLKIYNKKAFEMSEACCNKEAITWILFNENQWRNVCKFGERSNEEEGC